MSLSPPALAFSLRAFFAGGKRVHFLFGTRHLWFSFFVTLSDRRNRRLHFFFLVVVVVAVLFQFLSFFLSLIFFYLIILFFSCSLLVFFYFLLYQKLIHYRLDFEFSLSLSFPLLLSFCLIFSLLKVFQVLDRSDVTNQWPADVSFGLLSWWLIPWIFYFEFLLWLLLPLLLFSSRFLIPWQLFYRESLRCRLLHNTRPGRYTASTAARVVVVAASAAAAASAVTTAVPHGVGNSISGPLERQTTSERISKTIASIVSCFFFFFTVEFHSRCQWYIRNGGGGEEWIN